MRAGPTQRRRRGVEAIEFAMILPVYIVMLFSIFEFTNYMFQRSATVDAARRGCRAAAQLDPSVDDFTTRVSERVEEVLADSKLFCGQGGVTCEVFVDTELDDTPPRVICEASVTYRPLTGLFGQSSSSGSFAGVAIGGREWSGFNVLPDRLRGRSSAVFEGVAP